MSSSVVQDICDHILRQVKTSNLNFVITETPFAMDIKIKKTFLKKFNEPDKTNQPSDPATTFKKPTVQEATKPFIYNTSLPTLPLNLLNSHTTRPMEPAYPQVLNSSSNQSVNISSILSMKPTTSQPRKNCSTQSINTSSTQHKKKKISEVNISRLPKKHFTSLAMNPDSQPISNTTILPMFTSSLSMKQSDSQLINHTSSFPMNPTSCLPNYMFKNPNISSEEKTSFTSQHLFHNVPPDSNNSSLGTTKNSSLDPTNKSNLDPTSSSLAHTTSKNTSSSDEVTEEYAEVFNELKKFSMKVDAIGLEYQNFYEELKRK